MYAYPRTTHHSKCPINNLPIELLSLIFSLSTTTAQFNTEEYSPPTITTESVQVPLVLSSVNRLWRQVALGTPSLWSSLCITVELVQDFYCVDDERRDLSGFTKYRRLDTSHITSYLALSRKYPLDILIDARDENWNFEPEPELVSDYGVELYTPAFTSQHMSTVIALLLPHLSRCKSLSVLTDCWAPMYTALTAINPYITRFGAPLLQSLSFMRCNDLISFSPRFQPRHLKEPAFLKRPQADDEDSRVEWCSNMLPALKYLSLRGVHVDWDALGDSLATSEDGLESLELAWHSHDVRPSPAQFCRLLSSSSRLRSLVLSASGPSVSEEDTTTQVVRNDDCDYVPAHLPLLRNITIGYRTAQEGRAALELIDAPNAKELALEDAAYSGDPEVINAGPLLSYIGTRQFGEAHQNHRVIATGACELPSSGHHRRRQATETVVVASEKGLRNVSCARVNKDDGAAAAAESRTTATAAVFPLLERVTLRGVKTCSQPLRAFLNSLSNLQHLELIRMSMQAIHALLPSSQITLDDDDCTTTTTVTHLTTSPCPQLRSLCIRNFQRLDVQDVHFIIGGLSAERQNKGACQLREVDIHVDAAKMMTTSCVVVPPPCFGGEASSSNVTVNIISDSSDEDEDGDEGVDDGDDEDCYEDGEEDMGMGLDPYEPGGAFNDPLFDAYYASRFQFAR